MAITKSASEAVQTRVNGNPLSGSGKLLVVDDDRSVLYLIEEAFRGTEIAVLTAHSSAEGKELLEAQHPDVALLDVMLPEASGLDVMAQYHQADPKLPVIFITSDATSDTAIQAMKRGAYDYLLKPLNLDFVRTLVGQALETRRLTRVPVRFFDGDDKTDDHDVLIGRSQQMQEVYKHIGRVAPQNITVLIRGESGTGKELIARAIYQHSHRAQAPFMAINCAALPEGLLESELFGHEKGSFTGATTQRIGKFEQCSGGTLFLDEIGDMTPLVQSKVLRLIQEQSFERIGGTRTISTDVRLIAATHRDLEKMVEENQFRSDLYYRLNVYRINLAPLRERQDDILILLQHYLARFNRQLNKTIQGIDPEAMRQMLQYAWPGNVRELQSALKEAMLQTSGPVLMAIALPEIIRTGEHGGSKAASTNDGPVPDFQRFVDERLHAGSTSVYDDALKVMEQHVVTRVLRLTNGNQSKAAKILGITRVCLRNKIRALNLSIDRTVSVADEAEPAEA